MEDDAAHELHVEVPHPHRATRRLATGREGLDEQIVELGAIDEPLAKLVGPTAQLCIGHPLELGGEGIDRLDRRSHALGVALVLGAENGADEDVEHDVYLTLLRRTGRAEELARM